MRHRLVCAAVLGGLTMAIARGGGAEPPASLDEKVRSFLDRHQETWHDLNVPEADGKVLYDLIVSKRFTRALEIGTSTGRSTIWIAWALSKTGGKVTTLEIDPERHAQAVRNIQEAGLAPYVDARLGDAHELVRELPGPFDFVFSDADKGWYTQYFKDLENKLSPGACFTAHNVLDGISGVRAFLDYVKGRPGFATRIERSSRSGVSVSCRTSP